MHDRRLIDGALGADLEVEDDPRALALTTPRRLFLRLDVAKASRNEQQAALDRWFANPDAEYPDVLLDMLRDRGFSIPTVNA